MPCTHAHPRRDGWAVDSRNDQARDQIQVLQSIYSGLVRDDPSRRLFSDSRKQVGDPDSATNLIRGLMGGWS